MQKLVLTLIMLSLTIICYSQTYLKGKVITKNGVAIENANVLILGTTKGVFTNKQGEYKINNLIPKTYFIQVSYVGYATQTKSIQLNKGSNKLDITLVESVNELEEVIVSGANQRLENLQKTPVSIAAITAKEIENLQVNQISELNGIAPNFRTYDDGATGGFTLIASRGIATIDNHPVVGFYVDDIPYFDGFSFPLTLQDIGQIEVLRGPQGTLYGRNSLAGVVRITTKKPVNDVTGYLKVGAGNLQARDFTFAFNAPLVADKLFWRTSANVYDRDGYTTNLFNNKKLQNRKNVDVNIRLRYLASSKLSFDLLYNAARKESDAYVFSLLGPGIATTKDYLKDPYKVNFNEDVNRIAVTQNASFKAKVHFSTFDLTSITSYQSTKQNGKDEYDYSPLDIRNAKRNDDNSNITQEFRLTSNTNTKLKWNLGTMLYTIKTGIDGSFGIGKDGAAADPKIPFPVVRTDVAEKNQKGLAVYGQATYDITDQLAATAGIRFDYEESDVAVNRVYDTPLFPKSSYEQDANFNSFSPKLALSYQATDNAMFFINFAKGYRPGGINFFVTEKEGAIYNPETTQNIELGAKTNLFDNRLKLNLTGFYISYKDQQIYTVVDLNTFSFGLDNIGKSRSFGLELESKAALTKGLTFGLNIGYLNAKVEKYTEKIVNPKTRVVTKKDRKGNTLPFAPEFNGSTNLQFVQPISKKLNFEASTEYIYQSDIYFDAQNTTAQEGYGLLNAKLGVTTKHIDFFVWGKNIVDEAYFGYGYGVGGFNAATFGLPRTYGVNVTVKF